MLTTKQIEYWARIGKIAEENPDLTFDFIKGALFAKQEVERGYITKYARRTERDKN